MPADMMEKTSSSPVAATPASMNTTPDKPKTASEHRKSSKPIMEKRRRARINESLGQLKTLILDALKKDSSRHSKLEKADILEMTVKHLRNLQRAQMTAALNTDPTVLGKYRAGFSECMNEVTRFLSTCEGVNTEVRTRLLGHLANCMTQINAMNYPSQHQHQHQLPSTAGPTHPSFSQSMVQIPSSSPQVLPMNAVSCKGGSSPANLSSDATKVYGGFQIVPATDGQFAFLIPNAAFAPNGPVIPVCVKRCRTSNPSHSLPPALGLGIRGQGFQIGENRLSPLVWEGQIGYVGGGRGLDFFSNMENEVQKSTSDHVDDEEDMKLHPVQHLGQRLDRGEEALQLMKMWLSNILLGSYSCDRHQEKPGGPLACSINSLPTSVSVLTLSVSKPVKIISRFAEGDIGM
ncbi:uncharacterized protein V6R79_021306 [Siganus canaliculatus]